MDQLRNFLATVKEQGVAAGHFRGLLHALIAKRIARDDGTTVSTGMTWRDAAALLKLVRWDREVVRELGIDPKELAPRDREKFWYTAIARANLAAPEVRASVAELARAVAPLGYTIGQEPATE